VTVDVYVEGPSDKAAMEALLRNLIAEKSGQGIAIRFFEAPSGDKKESVVKRVPERAVSILRNVPNSVVIAMPDLQEQGLQTRESPSAVRWDNGELHGCSCEGRP
jgi:phenylpyruvate tautomerase PptA (4-oxalocrotonate tautomerase family)